MQFYASTPVTVNVRVTMNDSLRFPVLTLCNKNSFNVTRIKQLKLAKAAEDGNSNQSLIDLQNSCYNVSRLPDHCWNMSDLIGYGGRDAKQVWDLVAHRPEKIISEVNSTK